MTPLVFYVEGQTEQEYVTRVLTPHLLPFGVVTLNTIRSASGNQAKDGRVPRGGGRHYAPMRKDLGRILKQYGGEVRFTTMFDLYALYAGWPGWDEAETIRHIPRDRVQALEAAFAADVSDPRFIPHVQLYEFETILLCSPQHFVHEFEKAEKGIAALRQAVAESAGEPERVNDGQHSAPSKRIEAEFPEYPRLKTTAGVELAACVGVETTRQLCPHFHDWLTRLEALGRPG